MMVPVLLEELFEAADILLELFPIPLLVVMMVVVFTNAVFPSANSKCPEKRNQRHQRKDAKHDKNIHDSRAHLVADGY
jgi:hypothetical protein